MLAYELMNFVILLIRYSLGSLVIALFGLISAKLRLRSRQERRYAGNLAGFEGAEIWYHCSSEGELEQIWPLIQRIQQTTNEEQLIWFTSPSLMVRADRINGEGGTIHMCLLPLVSLYPGKRHPLRFGKPKRLFMVRYDFFAELIAVGKFRVKEFILLGATFKGKRRSLRKNPLKRAFARRLYKNFDEIYFSTQRDLDFYIQYCQVRAEQAVSCHDFRHGQIMLRQAKACNLEETHCLDDFSSLISSYDLSNRIIMGSMWPSELTVFVPEFIEALRKKELFLMIAPHKLSGEQWEAFSQWQENLDLEVTLWDQVGIHGKGNIILCQKPGLLCELYPFFGHSFIGGGHGRSVHSLLEPYWGGGHIYCGPRTQRSTEFDFVSESSAGHIHIVEQLEEFYATFKQRRTHSLDRGIREKLAHKVKREQEDSLISFCERSDS